MDDAAKDLVREGFRKHNAVMQEKLAPFYLGRSCPLNGFKECIGMDCSLFMLQGNAEGKVASGACCIPLIASQAGPIADGLMALASTNSSAVPRVIGTAGH